MSLLNPGPYGVADDDPKAILIRDLEAITRGLKVTPVIIGGIAVIVNGLRRQTTDVDLLLARDEAMMFIKRLEASAHFQKLRLDRFKHIATGAGLDLCVEGEVTSPRHKDRFPSPNAIEVIARDPLPVVGLTDLLALKAKSGRPQDAADFVRLFAQRGLSAADVESIKAKVEDPALRSQLDQWHAMALEDIERDKLRKPFGST